MHRVVRKGSKSGADVSIDMFEVTGPAANASVGGASATRSGGTGTSIVVELNSVDGDVANDACFSNRTYSFKRFHLLFLWIAL